MLTIEEEKEFTLLNALAFDLARLSASRKDIKIPTWLTSSQETKKQYLQNFFEYSKTMSFGRGLNTIEELGEFLEEQTGSIGKVQIEKWKQMEIELKNCRDKNDPHAFFC